MSYYDLTPDSYTPKELADEINNEVEEDRNKSDQILSLALALEELQTLSGDDPAKWNAIREIVQVLNDIDGEAKIQLEEGKISVTRGKK